METLIYQHENISITSDGTEYFLFSDDKTGIHQYYDINDLYQFTIDCKYLGCETLGEIFDKINDYYFQEDRIHGKVTFNINGISSTDCNNFLHACRKLSDEFDIPYEKYLNNVND